MRFTNSQLLRFVSWCALVCMAIGLATRGGDFPLIACLCFYLTPFVVSKIRFATNRSLVAMLILNFGITSALGFAYFVPKQELTIAISLTGFLLATAVFFYFVAPRKCFRLRHKYELAIPGVAGTLALCMAPFQYYTPTTNSNIIGVHFILLPLLSIIYVAVGLSHTQYSQQPVCNNCHCIKSATVDEEFYDSPEAALDSGQQINE